MGGLLLGFSGFAWIAIAAASVLVPLALLRSRVEHIALLLIFASAVIIAASSPPPDRHASHASGGVTKVGLLARVRARAARSIDQTFGDDAPLARALLIADQPYVFLYTAKNMTVASSKLNGFAPFPNQVFWNVDTWNLSQ